MTWLKVSALAAVLAIVGGGAARADEPAAGGSPGARFAGKNALAEGLAALRTRLEAKLKEAGLLQQAGRIDEALAATRDVERLYREGMADLERLVGPTRSAPATVPAPVAVPKVEVPGVDDDAGWAGEPGFVVAPAFAQRRASRPLSPVGGGMSLQQQVVQAAIRWLAAHQSADGGWEADGFDRWCDGKPSAGEAIEGHGSAKYDVGVSGLALSAMLGAGVTPVDTDNEFVRVERHGLAHLIGVQDAEGCFGARNTTMYVLNHARAALAMVEAYGMTGSAVLKASAQAALDFIARCRNPYLAWRYGVRPGDNDTSVTGWMALPLLSARAVNAAQEAAGRPAPLHVDAEAFQGVRTWLDKMTDPETGRVGYFTRGGPVGRPMEMVAHFPAEKSEATTAAAIFLRLRMDPQVASTEAVRKGAELVARRLPTWNTDDGSIDFEHWYFGGLALQQAGGPGWNAWERALAGVAKAQHGEGTYCATKGSWDPVDPWSPELGRVYSTAIVALSVESPNLYAR